MKDKLTLEVWPNKTRSNYLPDKTMLLLLTVVQQWVDMTLRRVKPRDRKSK